MKRFSLLLLFALALTACKEKAPLPTVDSVNLERYMGTWYEIQRLPNSFEEGLNCVTATYSLDEDGDIHVLNKGYGDGEWEDAKGYARVPDPEVPGELEVSFFRPFYGDYYIIELDPNYQYVLVGSPSREYLWILARSPELDSTTVNMLKIKASELGFDTSKMLDVAHNCQSEEA